mmetsp:Transcript_21018/g.49980  ORF Transcript_21018/g.49980 Transcript_21018/m.49980 type:complete len:247 (-) Transcript_21018:110-850(-)|eukprot:CAMPEP_0181432462 /NCGR_PEP_ID=MMETSP1110-20121109/18783_1 /TAXON_ID=174948 /ORGANISM="Symbiodinium sp., Strain CCMP421" /LENGTH=246 /DNA_ID=CAMNT_0023555873 /DNA_START=54 /DNA_END=794 /DNA_ORIENTATION=+
MCVANPMRDVHIGVKVEAAMPCSWAALLLMIAAPRLLVQRPPEVPVGVALVAVVFEGVGLGGRRLMDVVVDNVWRCVDIASLVNHVARRRNWHRHVDNVARLVHRHPHVVIDHMVMLRRRAPLAELLAAVVLLRRGPHLLPILIILIAIDHHLAEAGRGWPQPPPQQEAQRQKQRKRQESQAAHAEPVSSSAHNLGLLLQAAHALPDKLDRRFLRVGATALAHVDPSVPLYGFTTFKADLVAPHVA